MVVIGILGTLIVIVTILKSPRIKLRQQGFIVNLAIGDLIFLSVVMPFVLASIANNYAWVLGDATCAFVGFITVCCVQASMVNICLVAFNRYFSIVHFQHYKSVFTKRNIILMLVAAWVYAVVVAVPSFFGFGEFIYIDYIDICMYNLGFSHAHRVYIVTMAFALPLVLTGYFYFHILFAVMRSKRRVRSNPGTGTIKLEDIRLTVQVVLIFIWLIFCVIPFLTVAFIVDPYGELDRLFYDITVNLLVLNYVMNPFVYFFSSTLLRNEVRMLLSCNSGNVIPTRTSTVS
jgi:G protein-coupled receptor 50